MLFPIRNRLPLPSLPVGQLTKASSDADVWLSRALYLVVILSCALLLSRHHADPDFWGHVQYGRDALREGLPRYATYTYTAIFFPWINHENISEILFALGLAWGGPSLLLAAKVLAGVAFTVGLLWRARGRGTSEIAAQFVALITALNLMHFWSLRPQLFSFLLFVAEVLVIDHCFRCWKQPSSTPPPLKNYRLLLWTMPILFALWANTHGGFVLGLAVFGAYLGMRTIESIGRWRRAALPTAAAFSAILVVCTAATWLNPYGWNLHWWLFEDLRVPRPEIVEWRPPQLFDILWWQWWLLVAIAIAAVCTTKHRRDLVELAIVGLVLWQSVAHLRHIPFFAILCGLWLPHHVASLLERMGIGTNREVAGNHWSRWKRWSAVAALGGIAFLIALQIGQQLQRIPVHRNGYPVAAFQFIADHGLKGRMVVRFKWSQYAIAAFGSTRPNEGIKVAFDGRFRTCYPQHVADMYFDFAASDDASAGRPRSSSASPRTVDPRRILYYGNPDLVLIDRSQQLPAQTMLAEQDRWTLLYRDQIAELWGRRNKYDRLTSPDYIPPEQRVISEAIQVGHVSWPALPRPSERPTSQ